MDAKELLPWSLSQIEAGKIVAMDSTAALPAEAARDKEFKKAYGIKSSLSFPLSVGGELLGALGFNTTREERAWPTMPPKLHQAHEALDRAVDKCYRPEPFTSERQRVEFLFALYEKLTAPMAAAMAAQPKKGRKTPPEGRTGPESA
jgi:hypothetical protein